MTARTVVPWRDAVTESIGHDPRSEYAEACWLPIVGPSALWLMRRFAALLDHAEVKLEELAASIGLAPNAGLSAPLTRTMRRLVEFGLLHESGDVIAVRTALPPLTTRQLARLPQSVRAYDSSPSFHTPGVAS